MTPFTGAATYLPRTEALEKQFTFRSRFDEAVKVWYTCADDMIAIPRGAMVVQEKDLRDEGIAINFKSSFQPQKPEQPQIIQESVDLLNQDKQFILAAPTGFGKTFISTEIAGRMGRRFCVITTKEDILYQWVKAIQLTLNLTEDEIGIWRGDSTPKPHHKAVVALVQSVSKGPERYGIKAYEGFGLILCDEVHRMGADSFSQTMWHFPSKLRMGLSATPRRKDGKDQVFRWHIGPVMVEAKMEVLVPKVLLHSTPWKIPRTNTGQQIPHDFGQISTLMKPMCRNPQRNQLILNYLVSTWEKGRHTIAFSDNLEHLEIISDLLLQANVPEEAIGWYVGFPNDHYGIPKGTKGRKELEREVREKHSIRPIVLATYAMASEATNLPWLDTCILMTPKADVVQIVGRIRREYEDKKPPVVVDLVDRDSRVLASYSLARVKWYRSLGAQVIPYAD